MARLPQTQQAIVTLLEKEHLLSAPQIFAKLNKLGIVLNKTTVYRAIDKLLADGTVCRQVFGTSVPTYELRDDHHDHFICERCGRVEKIECNHRISARSASFKVNHHHETLIGSCLPKCKQ